MAGVKGQKNPSQHKRINGWSAGTQTAFRHPETFAFRPLKEYADLIKADMEDKGLSKQQWCDTVVAAYFEEQDEQAENPALNSLVQEAIKLAIATKQAAIRSEQKKKRHNQELIAAWQKEIEELESAFV